MYWGQYSTFVRHLQRHHLLFMTSSGSLRWEARIGRSFDGTIAATARGNVGLRLDGLVGFLEGIVADFHGILGAAEILVDTGSLIERKATIFALQQRFIPVFIRKDAHAWKYVGDYRVRGYLDSRAVIERKQREAGRSDVTGILYLERRGDVQ